MNDKYKKPSILMKNMWILFTVLTSMIILVISEISFPQNPCNFEAIGDGVCVCDTNYCDTLDTQEPSCDTYSLVTSSKSGKRFVTTTNPFDSLQCEITSETPLLEINQTHTYQNIIGFGGALTDASSIVIDSMEKSIRDCVFKSYVSSEYGAAYQIIRIPIGASDFSTGPWAYNETPNRELSNMTELHAYDRLRLNQINEMKMYQKNSDLKIMLCSWSPPPWMKSNKRWSGLSFLPREHYKTYALYQIKAIELWQNANVTIWSISTGNEPSLAAVVPFLSLGWLASHQKIWISNYLRPMLNQYGFSDVLILGVEDNQPVVPIFARAYQQSRDNVTIDIDLIGVHWYFDSLLTAGGLDRVSNKYKKPILYTESSAGAGMNVHDLVRGPVLGSWGRCQNYVHKMINNFLHSTSGFVDWNMVLNEHGGPNYVHNYVDAPMIFYNETQTLYKQPMFYGISHFSSFLQSNCYRIDAKLNVRLHHRIECIAFYCIDDDKVVTILHNLNSNYEEITVLDEKKGNLSLMLEPNSVNTLVYKNC